jgi:hypothetical protein
MKPAIALAVAAAVSAAMIARPESSRADAPASPSPAAAAAAENRETLATIKPMTEDMRVKAEDIDSVMQDKNVFFLDVREPKEIAELGSYEGYVNIPMSQLESRLGELPKDRPILTA